jgi:hypothetical protein
MMVRSQPHTYQTRRLAVAFAILLVALLAGCGSANTGRQTSSAKLVTYANTTYGFSIAHPAGWQVLTNPPEMIGAHPNLDFAAEWRTTAQDGSTTAAMFIWVCNWKKRIPSAEARVFLATILKTNPTSLEGGQPNGGISSVRRVSVGGQPAVLIAGVGVGAGTLMRQYWLVHDGVPYAVGFTGHRRDFTTFAKALSTLSFPTATNETYSNATYGFSIAHPTGWPQVSQDSGFSLPSTNFSVAWNKPVPQNEPDSSVWVGVSNWNARLSPTQATQFLSNTLAAAQLRVGKTYPGIPSEVIVHVRMTRLGGESAVLVVGRIVKNHTYVHQYMLVHAGVVYTVGLGGFKREFATTYRTLLVGFTLN